MERVYLYVHDLRSSGVVKNAITYAHRLAAERPVTLIAGYREGLFAADAADGPFEFVALAERPGRFERAAAALRLRHWLKKQPHGLLLSLGNLGHTSVLIACRGWSRFRRVYRISNEVVRSDGLRHHLRLARLRMLIGDAARLILVGRAFEGSALLDRARRTGVAVEIPNGVDLDRARRLAQAPPPHPWLEEDVPIVLGIGRLRPQKNFELLIEAVAAARAQRRLRLILIGRGTEEEQRRLQDLASNAGLAGDFLLAGETDNVFAWLARAAVFALPSRWEGSSMSLLEALAVGVPVVAARTAGDAAHVLGEGRYGALIEGGDSKGLAEAILKQSSPEAVRPGDRAESFTIAHTANAYASLVDELMREPA